MAGIGEKFKFLYNLFGFDNPDDTEFGELNDEYENEYETDGSNVLKRNFETQNPMETRERNNLRVLHGQNRGYEVVVFEPRAFNESINIVEALKSRKTVILNLQLLDREQSQRIVDFLCGCTHALDGSQRKIGEFVFIFTPSNINISQEVVNSKLTRDAIWTANNQ